MDDQFTPEPEDKKKGGNQRVLLLLLLLVVAAFGYVYYFTGVFRQPAEEAKPVAPPEVQVKKPLPPREEGVAPSDGKEAKPEGEKPAAPPAAPAAKPAEPPAKAPQKAPEKPVAKAPEQPAAKAPAKPAEKAPAKPTEKAAKPEEKPKVAAAPKQEAAKAPATKAEPKKQPLKAEPKEKAAPKQVVAKKAEAKPAKKETAAAEKPVAGGYTLVVGTYVVPSSMDADKEKVKKAGLTPVIVKGPKKPEPMVRIFIGDFPDRPAAEAEVQKVKKATEDAFILEEKGRFSVYGGSYFVRERAESERKRLAGEGVNATLKKASVPVATLQLRAGSFADKESAVKEANRLKALGLKVVVSPAK